jgi:hypothetical protein
MEINFKNNNLMSGLKGQIVQILFDYRVQNVWCTIIDMLFNNQHTYLFTNQCSSTRWMKMDILQLSSKLRMKSLPHEWKQKIKIKQKIERMM